MQNIRKPFFTAITFSITVAGAASASFNDFESFTAGQSINGQGGWTVEDSWGNSAELVDEAIIDQGGGNTVWRMSNADTNTGFSSQPYSSAATKVAGETGAGLFNDYGPNNTSPFNPPLSSATATSNYFYGGWDFKSATGAAQAGLQMAVAASARQSTSRQAYISMVDTGTGFNVLFSDRIGSTYNTSTIATNLNYTDWHRIEMYVEFVDGLAAGDLGNDIVNILVDGNLVHTGTTWESRYTAALNGDLGAARAVDALLFRSDTKTPSNAGNGFYFDNVDVSNSIIPEPASLALLGLGAFAVLGTRRRRA